MYSFSKIFIFSFNYFNFFSDGLARHVVNSLVMYTVLQYSCTLALISISKSM